MSQNLDSGDRQPSVAALLGDIIHDAQKLVRQEISLARTELHEEWKKTKAAAISFTISIVTATMGGILLAFMFVHLLEAQTDIPLWGCYGIVALVFVSIGAALFMKGKAAAKNIDFVPAKTVESMKENVQWITNQT